MIEFGIRDAEDGRIDIYVATPFGNLTVMYLDRETFMALRDEVNAHHDRMLEREMPKSIRKAFGED